MLYSLSGIFFFFFSFFTIRLKLSNNELSIYILFMLLSHRLTGCVYYLRDNVKIVCVTHAIHLDLVAFICFSSSKTAPLNFRQQLCVFRIRDRIKMNHVNNTQEKKTRCFIFLKLFFGIYFYIVELWKICPWRQLFRRTTANFSERLLPPAMSDWSGDLMRISWTSSLPAEKLVSVSHTLTDCSDSLSSAQRMVKGKLHGMRAVQTIPWTHIFCTGYEI